MDVLLTLCQDLTDLDALMAVDCALSRGWVTVAELASAAEQRVRGAPRLRRLLTRTRRSESAWETVLREFHREMGAAVTPQFEVYDRGAFVARGDLPLDGTRMLHEYDGEVHRSPEQQSEDIDDSLGRPHDRSRVRAWHAVLRTSAVTPAGRTLLWPRLQKPR